MKREEASEKEAVLRHEIGLAIAQADRGEWAEETSIEEMVANFKAGRG